MTGKQVPSAHLFHVPSGESTLRMKVDGSAIRLRGGDNGILLSSEAHGHRMEPAAGKCAQAVLFERR